MPSAKIIEEYVIVATSYLASRDEKWLMKAAELGRDAFTADVHPEDMPKLQKAAISSMLADRPTLKLEDAASSINDIMAEMLIAYGQARREQTETKILLAKNELLLRDVRDAKEQAEKANRAKSNFLASMSHELRTPLNAILGFSEIIRDQMLGDIGNVKYAEYANDVHNSGEHLHSLINDILDLSRIEAGERCVKLEDINLSSFLKDCLHLEEDAAGKKLLKLSLDLPDRPLSLKADKRAVKQIVCNLLSNALKFTGSGGTIILRAREGGSGGIEIAVIDTGMGIHKSRLNNVIKPFERIGGEFDKPIEGSGLGLSVVHELMRLHGGKIGIGSDLGKGTTVFVWFPSRGCNTNEPHYSPIS